VWGVETKSRELKSKLNRLRIQGPLRITLLKRVAVPHRIPTFWPHWHTMRDVTYYCNDPRFYQILGEIFFAFDLLEMIEIHRNLKLFEFI
jgi:hypothetical protein